MLAWLRKLLGSEGSPQSLIAGDGRTPDLAVPLGDASRQSLRDILEMINDRAVEASEHETGNCLYYARNWKPLSIAALGAIVEQTSVHRRRLSQYHLAWAFEAALSIKLLKEFARRDDVALPHILRFLVSIGAIRSDPRYMWSDLLSRILVNQLGCTGRASLLELHSVCEALKLPTDPIMANWFSRFNHPIAEGWPADTIWPYFDKHPRMLEEAFVSSSANPLPYWMSRERMFDALAAFPEPPVRFVPRLLEMALGSAKLDRAGAQRALDRLPDKEAHMIAALSSGNADARPAAATWLARLNCAAAMPELEAALARERNDGVAGALMSALETLGAPVDHFLNRAKLASDAAKGVAKGAPPDLAWFPFDRLPAVHWSDNGERVPAAVLSWLLIQSCKLKSPEPNGLLRRYCQQMRPAEREALASFVLTAWLEEDGKLMPADGSGVGLARSAIASKGILAVVAACGGAEIAPAAHRFIKQWYGTRAAQGKALIQMLAWVDHPNATQVLLSIRERFRTKGLQEEATRQIELLAERRSWTPDELADRTIPTAGFDESGELAIEYGERVFTARLTADLTIRLHTADGKRIVGLPARREAEDEARLNEAKKQLAVAKRELKTTVALQIERLYGAMCTERRWRYQDWSIYLNRHPIVRRHCRRLVWAVERPGEITTFRPRGDGTVMDVVDHEVILAPDDRIYLAHDTNTPTDVGVAWREHFARLEIEPLLQQFGKERYSPSEETKNATAITEFREHVVPALALRRRAEKLGYTRGAIQDGGFFYHYEKRFPSLDLAAIVGFSGSTFPETDRQLTSLQLWFARNAPEEHSDEGSLALADVPAVLLSECWNDIRLMAADGSGFAASRRQQTGQL
jgi:hypothetical protein